MKLLVDMNLSPRWAVVLSRAGHEAAHWSDIGKANASDLEIMGYARDHGYIVFTHDLDFSAILAATNGGKPSVIQVRSEDVSPDALGAQVIAVLLQMARDLDAGALLTLEPGRARARVLPLNPKANNS